MRRAVPHSESRLSVCALDCPDTCSLLVDIDTSGRAVRIRGNPDHPVTRGFLCAKVTRYLDREYHPERLRFPMRRVGPKGEGRFERISWEAALDEIASRLTQIAEKYGSEAILPYSYGGTLGVLNGSGMDRRFFHRLGASRLDRTICAAAGGAALKLSQGIKLGTEPEQFRHAKLILAWGANVLGTNVHLWPFIVEARRNGAKFYVIDPVKNRTGKAADRHFALHPGSDLALALGLAHVILRDGLQDSAYIAQHTSGFEEFSCLVARYTPDRVAQLTGLAAGDIETLAREYATTRPAAIRLNYGVQRNERGGAAVRAIATLPVLTGSWREIGGGMQLSTSGAFAFDEAAVQRPDLQFLALGREARIINMVELGSALTRLQDPPIQGLVVYNSNPAAVAPHQSLVLEGLRREDLFTVVIDHLPTDTADYADVLLPATTFLEHTDLYLAYGHYYLQLARPAVAPPGEAKSNFEIFRMLAKKMKFCEPCFDDSEDDMIRAALHSSSPFLHGINLERLERERFVRLNLGQTEDAPFLPFQNGGFSTPSGKFEFGAETLAYTPPHESRLGDAELHARYPLELISSKNDDSLNSSFGYRDAADQQTSTLQIHPEDAASRGISDGMEVEVFNDRGSCFFTAKISGELQKGLVWSRSMRWSKRAPFRAGVNQLTSERLTDIGGGPTFYSCLVEVRPVRSSTGTV